MGTDSVKEISARILCLSEIYVQLTKGLGP